MNQNFLIIPISLCIFSIQKKCVNQFQLYCWLKTQCSGHFKLTNQLKFRAYNELEINLQTLRKRLNWLLRKKWIAYNHNSENYRIASFKQIQKRIEIDIKKAVIWDYNEFKLFRAFVDATVITYCGKRKFYSDKKGKNERWKESDSGVKLERTRTRVTPPSFTIPVKYLAKILSKSNGFVVKMKQNASDKNFISIEKNLMRINVPMCELKLLQNYHPEGNKFICKGNQVFEQKPDLISSVLIIKTKRNLTQNEANET